MYVLQVQVPKRASSVAVPSASHFVDSNLASASKDDKRNKHTRSRRNMLTSTSECAHSSGKGSIETRISSNTGQVKFSSSEVFYDELWPYGMSTKFPLAVAQDNLKNLEPASESLDKSGFASTTSTFGTDCEEYESASEEVESDSGSYISAVQDLSSTNIDLDWEEERSELIFNGADSDNEDSETDGENMAADTVESEFTHDGPNSHNDKPSSATEFHCNGRSLENQTNTETEGLEPRFCAESIFSDMCSSQVSLGAQSAQSLASEHLQAILSEVIDLNPNSPCDSSVISSALAEKGLVLKKIARELILYDDLKGFERLRNQLDKHMCNLFKNSDGRGVLVHEEYEKNLKRLVRQLKIEIGHLKND